MVFNLESLLKLINYYISYLAQIPHLTYSHKPQAFVLLPLQSSISLGIFTSQNFIIKKAFFDFTARLSFSYLSLLIKGSIKFRLFISLAFILLIYCDVNHDTARSCVLLGLCAYYVYKLRNVKFNLLTWLYTLTSILLTLSIIITFWWLLSLAIPYIIILCNVYFPFPHGYNLSINPTDPDISGGNSPGKAGGPVGGDAGGPGGDPNSQNTLMEKGKSPQKDKDEEELEKLNIRITEIIETLNSLKENCLEKRNYAEWTASKYTDARKDFLDVSQSTIMEEDYQEEGFVPTGDLEHINMYYTYEHQEAEDKMRAAGREHNKAQEDFEQAENALRKTGHMRIELDEAASKRSLLEQSKKK